MASSESGMTAEYQHFVPQFLLRNFSKKYRPPKGGSKRQPKQGRGKDKRLYPGEPVVNHVDLTADQLAIQVAPVKRVLGINNMYEDFSQGTAKQRRHIEDMFGKLESQASPAFRKITKAFEEGSAGIWLTRDERNSVRKFLFLLKYRGSGFHQRFYHDTPEEYESDDKRLLRQYMRDKGFERPTDVWFHNLKAIAECKMDAKGEWMTDIAERMYPLDADWFRSHAQNSYMALCVPSDKDAEFLLAENSYNVHEGLTSYTTDAATGEQIGSFWVNFHDFAPVSPKVMIVLRSFLVPSPEEASDPHLKEYVDMCRAVAVDHVFGPGQKSQLADLPIAKARNSYTEIVDGQPRLLRPETPRSAQDKFFFEFSRINNDHVNKINSFMLDNSRSNIVFATPKVFTKTLEWYLTNTSQTWKNVVGTHHQKEVETTRLTKLAALMKSLGSNAKPVFEVSPDPKASVVTFTGQGPTDVLSLGNQTLLNKRIKELDRKAAMIVPPPTPFLELFIRLGGTLATRMYNTEQSSRMLKLRIKLDVWTQGAPEPIRDKARNMLRDIYLGLLPVRVWLYAKQIRNMHFGRFQMMSSDLESNWRTMTLDQPEDVVAIALIQVTRSDILNRHVYNTAMNSIEKDKVPAFNVWGPIGQGDFQSAARMRKFAFRSGPVGQCGIPEIEGLANEELALIMQDGICPEVKGYKHFLELFEMMELSGLLNESGLN